MKAIKTALHYNCYLILFITFVETYCVSFSWQFGFSRKPNMQHSKVEFWMIAWLDYLETWKLKGENLKVAWAEFPTLSYTVLVYSTLSAWNSYILFYSWKLVPSLLLDWFLLVVYGLDNFVVAFEISLGEETSHGPILWGFSTKTSEKG